MTKILEAEALARKAELPLGYIPEQSECIASAIYDVGASIVQSLDRHHEIARACGRSEAHIADAIRELIALLEADDSGHTIAHHAEAIATHLREIDTTLGTK